MRADAAGSPVAGWEGRSRAAGHAEHDGAVPADHGDCLVDLGALASGQVAAGRL